MTNDYMRYTATIFAEAIMEECQEFLDNVLEWDNEESAERAVDDFVGDCSMYLSEMKNFFSESLFDGEYETPDYRDEYEKYMDSKDGVRDYEW